MKRKRDYAAEYQRRLKRALDKGYSRSVARGHPKKGEIGLKRAKAMLVRPGIVITGKGRHGTIEHPWRPTYAMIRKRLKELGLPLSHAILRGKKGLIPIAWRGNPRSRYLDEDPTRDDFIDYYTRWGLTEHEAYTLWFSP